jgi:ubiquitin-like protein 4
LTTSIFDLKSSYAARYSVPVEKIKILFAKKPIADSKTLADVLGGGDEKAEVEFSVMLMGGVTPSDEPPKEKSKAKSGPAAQGPSGKEVLNTEEFWDDLKGFLVQRLRDEGEGERLAGLFRKAAG